MMGAFAEFERAMIQERVNASLDSARAKGTTLGQLRVGKRFEQKFCDAYAGGMSKRAIARDLGISDGTVRNVLAQGAATARSACLIAHRADDDHHRPEQQEAVKYVYRGHAQNSHGGVGGL
jgi:DNA invertase Pin-like site-specific DNA recombinase